MPGGPLAEEVAQDLNEGSFFSLQLPHLHQHTGGEKNPTGFLSTPGRGQIKTKYFLNPVRGKKTSPRNCTL